MSVQVGTRVVVKEPMLTKLHGRQGEVVESGAHHVLKPTGAVWWVVRLDGDTETHMFDASQIAEVA